MPRTYRQVLEEWDRSRAFGDPRDLKKFSADMNVNEPGEYTEGLRDGTWTRASTRLDQALQGESGSDLVDYTVGAPGKILGAVGGAVAGDLGEETGKSIPRGLLNTAPLVAAELLSGGLATGPILAAGALGTGAAMGAHTYADTGSGKAALVSGAIGAALPYAGRYGGSLATKALGVGEDVGAGVIESTGVDFAGGLLPKTAASENAFNWARFGGSQTGQIATGLSGSAVQAAVMGQTFDPLDPHFWAQQIPFTVLDGFHVARAKPGGLTAEGVKPLTSLAEPAKPRPVAKGTAEEQARAGAALEQLLGATADPTPGAVDAALTTVQKVVNEPQNVVVPTEVAKPPVYQTTLRGQARKSKEGGWKMLVEDHDSETLSLEPHKNVWINSDIAPKFDEASGKWMWTGPESKINPTGVKSPILPEHAEALRPKVEEETPELPERAEGVEPTKMPEVETLLTPDEITHVATMVDDPTLVPSTPEVKAAIATHEQATAAEEQARAAVTEPLNDPTTLADIVPPERAPDVKAAQERGATETQAIEAARLGEQTGKVEVALVTQTAAATEVKQLTALQQARLELEQKGAGQIARFIDQGKSKPDIQEIVDAYLQAQREGAARPNITSELNRVLARWDGDSVGKLKSAFKLTANRGEGASGGKSLLNAEGKRDYFSSESEVLEHITNHEKSNPSNDTEYTVMSSGSGTKKRYYAGTRKKGNISTDTKVGEDGATFGDFLPTEETGGLDDQVVSEKEGHSLQGEDSVGGSELVAPDNLPAETSLATLRMVEAARKSPSVFAMATDVPEVLVNSYLDSASAVLTAAAEGKLTAKNVNEKLGKALFKDDTAVIKRLRILQDGLGEFRKMSDFTLGSLKAIPPEQFVAQGWDKGVRGPLEWLEKNGKNEMFKPLVRDLLHALPADADPVLAYPGHAGHDGTPQWYYENGRINVGSFRDPEHAALLVAHEMAHHATRELAGRGDPAALAFKKTLEDVRQALLKASPPEVQRIVAESLKRGLYEQHGAVEPVNLHNEWRNIGDAATVRKHSNLIYALHNGDELLAQFFNAPDVVALASKTQIQKETLLQRFVSAAKRLIGLGDDRTSAFETLMTGFQNYLSSNRNEYNGMQFARDLLVQTGVRPEALAGRLATVQEIYTSGSLEASLRGYEQEAAGSTLPVSSSVGKLNDDVRTALTSVEPKAVADSTMSLLLDELPVHSDVLQRMSDDLHIVGRLREEATKGSVAASVPDADLAPARANVNAMRSAMEKQNLAVERLNQLKNFTEDGLNETAAQALAGRRLPAPPDPTGLESDAHELMGLKEGRNQDALEGKGVSKMAYWWKTIPFLKREVPAFRAIADIVSKAQANYHFRVENLKLALGWEHDTGTFSRARVKTFVRVASTPGLELRASDILRYAQKQEAVGKMDWFNDQYVKDNLSRLSAAPASRGKLSDRDAVLQAIQGIQQRHALWTGKIVPEHLDSHNAETIAYAIAAKETGITANEARSMAGQMVQGLHALSDPEGKTTIGPVAGGELIKQLASRMAPATFADTVKLAQGLMTAADEHIAFLRSRPTYVSEQRYGKHQLVMKTPEGKESRTSYDSREEALTAQKQFEQKGYTRSQYIESGDANVKGGMSKDLLDSMQELDRQVVQRLQEFAGGNPDLLAAVLPMTQRANDYLASTLAFSPVPQQGAPKRLFKAGNETLNMLKQSNEFYQRGSSWMRHRMIDRQTDLQYLDPTLQDNSQLLQLSKDYVNSQKTPDSQIATNINKIAYFKSLAFNFGNMVDEALQPLMTGMTSLIGETGSVKDAFYYTGLAYKALKERGTEGGWRDLEVKGLVDRMTAEGRGGWLSHGDLGDAGLDGMKELSILKPVTESAAKITGLFTKANDIIGSIAAYKLARERGMDIDGAYDFAMDVKERGGFSAGKAGRSIGFWNIKERAVPQLMASLQGYTIGWFNLLAHNWKVGFRDTPPGMTPTQVLGAKKAFFYQLAAQATMAGALGLPGVGQGLALMKQATGVDAQDYLRKNLAGLFGEDQTTGGFGTMLAMHGAVAASSLNDPSGRYNVGVPFTGVGYKGFELQNFAPAGIRNATDMLAGMVAAARGDTQGVARALPHVFQGPFKLITGDEPGTIKDRNGTYALSPAEQWFMAAGMKSSRVTMLQEAQANVAETKRTAAAQQKEQVEQVAALVKSGDTVGAQTRMAELQQADTAFRTKSFAGQVARVITPPNPGFDMMSQRSGSATDTLYNRASTKESLGLPSAVPSFSAAGTAARSDALIQANPFLDPAVAKRRARQETAPTRNPYAF